MAALDRLIPTPRMVETDCVELAAPAALVWERVRHLDLARSPLARALFVLRTLPARIFGERTRGREPPTFRVDDLVSTTEHPGFQLLVDDPPRELAVGAIGKVWQLDIPFEHVADAAAFAAFAREGFVKVAWSLHVVPRGEQGAAVELQVRVDATGADAWARFRRYWTVIGPASRFIRRSLLASLARELGTPESRDEERPPPRAAVHRAG